MKPNWMIIGAAKAGSSSLAYGLGTHPDVFLTEPKETHFFARDEEYQRGLAFYEAHYDGAANFKARGEASNNYTMKEVWPHAAQRIHDFNPDLKLIYIVREPFSRIASWWVDCRSWGSGDRAHYDFKTALRLNAPFLIDSTNYGAQLDHYLQLFPERQTLVLFMEDLNRQPQSVYRRCFEFLGVDPAHEVPPEVSYINATGDRRMVAPLHSKLRENRLYRAAMKLVPQGARAAVLKAGPVRKVMTTKQDKPVWDAQAVQIVRDRLGDAPARFLERFGKPADFWPAAPKLNA